MMVLGVLKTSEWGWVEAKSDDSPALFGLSLSLWLIMGGIMVIWAFFRWQARLQEGGKEPLIDPALLEVRQLRAGLVSFFSQYFLQAGVFFLVPLFLSIVLGMSAIDTGLRLVPLSLTLLLAAVGVPKLRPNANPRRVVRIGLLCFLVGLLLLLGGLELGADASIVAVPMLLIGFGIGAHGLAARRRHRVGGARREEPRGRRLAEHGHQPRHLAEHGAGGLDPDRRAHFGVHRQHRRATRTCPTR